MDRQSAVHRFAAAWADGVDLPPVGEISPPPAALDPATLRYCGQAVSLLLKLAEETAPPAEAALQQDPDALPEARLQEIQSVHHRSGPDEDPDHDTRAHCHRGELLEEVQRLKKRLCQALQQHLDDLQRAHDSQAQVFGELRGVVTNLEAQLASERARNERLMDRLEQLQERFMVLGAASLATLESAPGPDGQPGATDPTSSAEDK